MPTVDLTQAEIDKGNAGRLTAPKTGRILYWDRTTPGFALMVTHTNARSFVVQYRPVGSRESRRMKLRGKLSLKEARREARDLLNAVAKRADPLAERRAAAAAAKETEMPGSLRAEVKEYFRLEGPKLRSRKDREAAFDRLVLPKLGDKDVPAISRKDIVALLDDIEKERGASMADHVLRYLSRFFNWYPSRNEDFRTPIGRGMARLKESERRRQSVLNDAELRAVWQAADASPCAFNRLVQFILTTATRRNEAARAQRREIIERENGRVLVIPNERYKTNLTFVVPLSSLACEVLDKVPHIGSKWIFTTDGKRAVAGFGKAKAALTEAALEHMRRENPQAVMREWTLHDLRRTARSLMPQAGVDPDTAERCLGHTLKGVRRVYDQHDYLQEKKQAFEALAQLLRRIIDPHANVVEFSKKAPKRKRKSVSAR